MMNKSQRLIFQICIGCLILIMTACAVVDDPVSTVDLSGTQWNLISYGEPGSESEVLKETQITLQFDQEGQAGGSGGCNTFGAQYEISNGSISFTVIMSTEMACLGEGVMDQETAYYQALNSTGAFKISNRELKIWYNDGQEVLNFMSMNPFY